MYEFCMQLAEQGKAAWEVLGPVVSAVFAALAWIQARRAARVAAAERARLAEPVAVKLTSGNDSLVVPLEFSRGDLERSELLGRLGGYGRFAIPHFGTAVYLRDLRQLRSGSGPDAVLTVPVSSDTISTIRTALEVAELEAAAAQLPAS